MIRRLIDMQASSEIGGYSAMQAYGTPEGVEKAWDTRGRVGKHPAHGTFSKVPSGSAEHTYYQSKDGQVTVHIHEPLGRGATRVFEHDKSSSDLKGRTHPEQQVFKVYTKGNASQFNDFHDFLKQRYGIEHNAMPPKGDFGWERE
jgi:hypothetical protein